MSEITMRREKARKLDLIYLYRYLLKLPDHEIESLLGMSEGFLSSGNGHSASSSSPQHP